MTMLQSVSVSLPQEVSGSCVAQAACPLLHLARFTTLHSSVGSNVAPAWQDMHRIVCCMQD
jgi:hypothetical protein